jgi:hypothetical protein
MFCQLLIWMDSHGMTDTLEHAQVPSTIAVGPAGLPIDILTFEELELKCIGHLLFSGAQRASGLTRVMAAVNFQGSPHSAICRQQVNEALNDGLYCC